MLRYCILILLLLCSGLAGCAGQTGPAPAAPQDPPGSVAPQAGLPGFPAVAAGLSALRQASAGSVSVNGDDYADQGGGGNYSPGGGTYIIIPGSEDELAWAQYNVGGVTDGKPVKLSLSAAAAAPQGGGAPLPLEYWLGLANYTSFRWEWKGPYSGSTSLELNTPDLRDRYVSAAGTMSYVVFVLPGAAATPENPQGLNGVALRSSTTQTPANYLSNKPHYTLADQPAGGDGKYGSRAGKAASALQPDQHVTLRWQHVTAFNPGDQQNEAFQYQVFRQGPLDTQPVNIGSVLAPETAYVDPLDNASSAPDPTPGATYSYYLRAVNPTGYTPLDLAGSIKIPLLPPAGLAATDGVFDDKIRLTWTKAEGASSYEIYRDDLSPAAEPFAVVGNVNTWIDETVPDVEVHLYAVRSRNPFAASALTGPEPGNRRQMIQTFDLMEGDETNGPFILYTDAEFNPQTNQPVASYTAYGGDMATHLYEFAPGTGWEESTPTAHGDPLGGANCDFEFAPNGDLACLFGNINWDGIGWDAAWETDFGLRLNGQSSFSFEHISTSMGPPFHLEHNPADNEWGLGWTVYDTQNFLGLRHGAPGNFIDYEGTPVFTDVANGWNYAVAFDPAGNVYASYTDGQAKPLNLWYSVDGTWQTLNLDPAPCFGVNIASGPDGTLFILYQRRNAEFVSELRMIKFKLDELGNPSYSSELVIGGAFLGYLNYFTTSLAVDSQNQPHIIYPTNALNGGIEQLWYRYRDAQGWAEPYELDDNSGGTYTDARQNALALDANDKPLCVFAHNPYHLKAVWFK